MKLSDLLEDGNKDLVIIYPGRFHPFHIGHGKVYKYLKQKYSNAKVFISTSGKVDGDRSPFTFEEKRKMMILAGVSSSDIVQTKSPYQSIEIMERFDKDNTVVVFAVSEKDMAEDPRFDFSNGLKLKKNGEPAYLQKWNSLDDAETFATRGYIATTPTFKFKVLGQEINSASQIRNMIAKSDDTKLTQMLQDLYSVTDVPQDIIDLFKNKVGNKETMNENWDEHSFSKFLKENVIEDNIMKKGILTTITEGKSPHKKGTKKYNAHMAAMHAESIDEEFDRKVKKILLGKKSMKTNEWVQEPHEGQKWSGQEKNFIQDLCKRHDGIQMQWPKPQTGADGIKGPSPLWDEGKIMSNDADLQKLLSWVEKNKHDVESYFKSDFRVYSNKDKGQSQSDGNQVLDNIRAKIGSVNEEQLDEVVFLAPWILPAVATAIRFAGPPALAALRLLLKGGSKAAPKIVKTGGNLVQKSTGTGLVVGAVGKTIYDNAKDAYDGIKNWFKLDMDEDTIKVLAQLVVKYGIPLGGIAAILYGGKQLKDYMSGEEEEEKGNTTINNYYNKSDDKPVEESYSDDFVYNSDEVKEWIAKAENDLGREITNEEKAELNEFWPQAAMAIASRIPPSTYASAGIAIGSAASKAGKWIKSKLKSSVDPKLKEDYANDQHEKLEYIHSVLQECGDGNMDITMVEQAMEYVEDIREQHFDDEGNTKSESVNEEDVNEHEMGLLGKVARQMEADAHSGDYTAIEELLHNVSEEEMEAFLSDHRSDEGVMGTIGQGIDNAVVGTGRLIKKGAKALAPHVKKAAKDGVKKMSKLGSKNTSYDMKTGKTNTTYGMANATEAYNEDDKSDLDKMQGSYKHNEDRNAHSENILMLAHAFGSRPEIKAVEGLIKVIRRQGHTTPEQSEMMYNAIHKKYYGQLFPSENEGNAFSAELAKAKIDGKKNFDVDGKTYKVKEALTKLIDNQKIK